MLGVGGAALFGMAALATEGGSWYLLRRDLQSAADTAARAGAVRLAMAASYTPQQTLATAQQFARSAATDDAGRNGFTQGGSTALTVNTPPQLSPGWAGNTAAVEVRILRSQPRSLSRLFTGGSTTQQVAATAVAVVQQNGTPCILGLGLAGQESGISGNGTPVINTPNCSIASNASGPGSISLNGNATVDAASIVSAGGCVGCSGTVLSYQPATTNPYAWLDGIGFTQGSCTPPPQPAASATITVPGGGTGSITFCQDVTRTGNAALTLTPGTYIFWNASFSVQNGSVTCPGCTGGKGVTLIFTGTTGIGGPSFTGGTVTLNAPATGQGQYPGVLMYRDIRASAGNCNNPPVDLEGNANMTLSGGMYFPSSCVRYAGGGSTACSVLVAGAIQFRGTSRFETSGCAGMNVPVPTAQTVRLVL